MGLTLRLLRHGRTEWSDAGRYCGHRDVPLSVEGRRELARLDLPFADYTTVRSSDLLRCRQTAEVLALTPTLEPALREFDFGGLEGKTWDDLNPAEQAALLDYESFVAPGGESVADFGRRIDTAIESLVDGHHLLITHGGVIQHLLRHATRPPRLAPGEWTDLAVSRR